MSNPFKDKVGQKVRWRNWSSLSKTQREDGSYTGEVLKADGPVLVFVKWDSPKADGSQGVNHKALQLVEEVAEE